MLDTHKKKNAKQRMFHCCAKSIIFYCLDDLQQNQIIDVKCYQHRRVRYIRTGEKINTILPCTYKHALKELQDHSLQFTNKSLHNITIICSSTIQLLT